MTMIRRDFLKFTAFTTAGIFLGVPLPLLFSFRSQACKHTESRRLKLKVIGLGWTGCHAVGNMARKDVKNIHFIAADMDPSDLRKAACSTKILLESEGNRGLVSSEVARRGYRARLLNRKVISNHINGTDLVIIVGGMGGGTCTAYATVTAQESSRAGTQTVAVVTTPFPFEGRRRLKDAEEGVRQLEEATDKVIVVPNSRVLSMFSSPPTLLDAFKKSDEILSQVVGDFVFTASLDDIPA